MKRQLIKCSDIQYRQGFIEVEANIHVNAINIETWNIDPKTSIEEFLNLDALPDDAITGNTEIELNLAQAVALVSKLQSAIELINPDTNNT